MDCSLSLLILTSIIILMISSGVVLMQPTTHWSTILRETQNWILGNKIRKRYWPIEMHSLSRSKLKWWALIQATLLVIQKPGNRTQKQSIVNGPIMVPRRTDPTQWYPNAKRRNWNQTGVAAREQARKWTNNYVLSHQIIPNHVVDFKYTSYK